MVNKCRLVCGPILTQLSIERNLNDLDKKRIKITRSEFLMNIFVVRLLHIKPVLIICPFAS